MSRAEESTPGSEKKSRTESREAGFACCEEMFRMMRERLAGGDASDFCKDMREMFRARKDESEKA